MNSQSIAKLELILSGLTERLKENRDFFKKITVEFKSGLKTFTGNISLDSDKLVFDFNGRNEVLEKDWFAARLAKYAQSYESILIIYEERATSIIIEADNKNVRSKYVDSIKNDTDSGHIPHNAHVSKTAHSINTAQISKIGGRDYLIKVGEADAVLKAIGILSSDGKIKNDMIRKYNQIDHFVELIESMIKSLSDKKSINILDCGCGKSYLSFVLNYYICEVLKKQCYVTGIDYSKGVIEASSKMAHELGYHNMRFLQTDIRSFVPERKIDLVISLHACDTATDEAIAAGIRMGAKAIAAVPCCHRELLSQYSLKELQPILKYGVLKARLADIITDGLRAQYLEAMGYQVSVVEYISPLETPKNLLIRAEKVGGQNVKAMEEYEKVKNLLGVFPSIEMLMHEEDISVN